MPKISKSSIKKPTVKTKKIVSAIQKPVKATKKITTTEKISYRRRKRLQKLI